MYQNDVLFDCCNNNNRNLAFWIKCQLLTAQISASCRLDSASSSRSEFSLYFYLIFNREGQFPIIMKINRNKKGNTLVRSCWHLGKQKASIAPSLLWKMSLKHLRSYQISTSAQWFVLMTGILFYSILCLERKCALQEGRAALQPRLQGSPFCGWRNSREENSFFRDVIALQLCFCIRAQVAGCSNALVSFPGQQALKTSVQALDWVHKVLQLLRAAPVFPFLSTWAGAPCCQRSLLDMKVSLRGVVFCFFLTGRRVLALFTSCFPWWDTHRVCFWYLKTLVWIADCIYGVRLPNFH